MSRATVILDLFEHRINENEIFLEYLKKAAEKLKVTINRIVLLSSKPAEISLEKNRPHETYKIVYQTNVPLKNELTSSKTKQLYKLIYFDSLWDDFAIHTNRRALDIKFYFSEDGHSMILNVDFAVKNPKKVIDNE